MKKILILLLIIQRSFLFGQSNSNMLFNKGNEYLSQSDYKNAIEIFNRIKNKTTNTKTIFICNYKLIQCYSEMNDSLNTYELMNQNIQLWPYQKFDNKYVKSQISINWYILRMEISYRFKDYAEIFILSKMFFSISNLEAISPIYSMLVNSYNSLVYIRLGEFKNAYDYSKKCDALYNKYLLINKVKSPDEENAFEKFQVNDFCIAYSLGQTEKLEKYYKTLDIKDYEKLLSQNNVLLQEYLQNYDNATQYTSTFTFDYKGINVLYNSEKLFLGCLFIAKKLNQKELITQTCTSLSNLYMFNQSFNLFFLKSTYNPTDTDFVSKYFKMRYFADSSKCLYYINKSLEILSLDHDINLEYFKTLQQKADIYKKFGNYSKAHIIYANILEKLEFWRSPLTEDQSLQLSQQFSNIFNSIIYCDESLGDKNALLNDFEKYSNRFLINKIDNKFLNKTMSLSDVQNYISKDQALIYFIDGDYIINCLYIDRDTIFSYEIFVPNTFHDEINNQVIDVSDFNNNMCKIKSDSLRLVYLRNNIHRIGFGSNYFSQGHKSRFLNYNEYINLYCYCPSKGGIREAFNSFLNNYSNLIYNTLFKSRIDLKDHSNVIANHLGNKSKLTIIPTGALTCIPFETFKDDANKYLCEMYNIQYVQSLNVFLALKSLDYSKVNRKDIVFIGNDTFDDFKSLPYVKPEIRICSNYFSDKYDVIYNINKKKFDLNVLSNYKIIHFAGHGKYDDDFTKSSIPLNHGYVDYKEITSLSLKADLVTLSLCAGAKGNSYKFENNISLSRAFFQAGSKAVVASLWNVNEYSTSLFMETFYSKIHKKISYADALIETKRLMIKDEQFKDPFYWGAFVYYGE